MIYFIIIRLLFCGWAMPKLKDAFLNYFPIGYIPFLKKIQTTKFREMFSPEEREARYQEYRASVGLAEGLANTDAFKKYEDARVNSLDKLSQLKTGDEKSDPVKIDGKTITERLNKTLETPGDAADAVPEVKNAFAAVFALSEETQKARKNFDEDVKAINTVIRKDPPEFSLAAIADRVQDIRKAATDAIDKQQKAEIQRVTALFDGPMADKIKLSMGINDEQLATLKTDTLSTLGKKHKDEKTALDKSIADEETKLHKLAQTERDRISFLASLYENSEFMKKMIDELHAKELNRLKAEGLTDDEIVMAMGPEMIKSIANTTLKNIGIGDLSQIETETGLKINVGKDAKGEISFSVELPNVYNKERYLATMTCLAMSNKACGHEHCTITITDKDEEKALRAARLAYEGQAIAGYPPENRHIVVNGKTKSLGEIFPSNRDGTGSTKLAAINEMYQKNLAKKERLGKSPLEEQEKLKKAVQQERERQNVQPPEPGQNRDQPGGLTL